MFVCLVSLFQQRDTPVLHQLIICLYVTLVFNSLREPDCSPSSSESPDHSCFHAFFVSHLMSSGFFLVFPTQCFCLALLSNQLNQVQSRHSNFTCLSSSSSKPLFVRVNLLTQLQSSCLCFWVHQLQNITLLPTFILQLSPNCQFCPYQTPSVWSTNLKQTNYQMYNPQIYLLPIKCVFSKTGVKSIIVLISVTLMSILWVLHRKV